MVSKKKFTMPEQGLLDMFVQERINMLLDTFHKKLAQEGRWANSTDRDFIENLQDKEISKLNITLILSQVYLP